MTKNKFLFIIILIIIFATFYAQNRYAIISIDDWTYAFIVNNDAINYLSVTDDNILRQPVSSFYDAIISQSRDYFKTNGRFIIHSIVQYICGTKTMLQFVFLNSIMFVIFTLLVIRLSNCKYNIYNILFIFSSIWLLFPHKGLTFMGNITCSVNYLWSSVAILLFIFLFIWSKNRKNSKYSIFINILLSIYAFIAGSLQESFTIGITGSLLVYIIYKRRYIDNNLLVISIAFMIGTLSCIISPANFRRFDDIGGSGFHSNCLLGLLSSPVFILFLVIIIVSIKKQKLLDTIKTHFFIVFPIIINLCFVIFIAYNGRHQLTAINVFCLIFIIRIWNKFTSHNIKTLTTILLTTITVISYYPILQIRKNYYESYKTILYRIDKHNNNGIVSGKEFEYNNKIIKNNRIIECNYITTFTFQDWDFYEKSLSIYLTKGESNKLIKEVTQ